MCSRKLVGFKGSPSFYKNIKESYITLEKERKKKQKEFNSDINEIVKVGKIRRAKICNKKFQNNLLITRKSYQVV